MSIPQEIGRNIIHLRKKKKMSQEWLALESETAVSYLRAIEHGLANPTIEVLSRISDVLDVPLNLLVTVGIADQSEQEPRSLTISEIVFIHRSQTFSLCSECQQALDNERRKFGVK